MGLKATLTTLAKITCHELLQTKILVQKCHNQMLETLKVVVHKTHQCQKSVHRPCHAACSWRRAPRLWLIALVAALVLLLTIILCAVLIGNSTPKFVGGPSVVSSAGHGFDTSMAIDHSGFIYYTVIPADVFLSELDPG